MIKSSIVIGFFGLAISSVACGGSGSSEGGVTSANRLALDVRCAVDTDCPAGFECEVEAEHGTSTSFCKAHVEDGVAAPTTCPAGFEPELEHGGSLCKPQSANPAPSAPAPSPTPTPTCTTDADCAAGLQCETEIEHGVTTTRCKAHGGK